MKHPNQRAEELFATAIEIADAAARRAYLDQACAGDADLRQEVESLLVANSAAGELLLHPPPIGASEAQKTMFIPSLPELTARASDATSSWSTSARAASAWCGWRSKRNRCAGASL